MSKLIVLYDACVLYPAPLPDLLMHLAMTNLFRAKWTNQIHEEWITSVLGKRPDLKKRQLLRTRDLMNQHAMDCLVHDYEKLIPSLQLPDKNDRHVLAAAIKTSASIILTYNLKDFPQKILNEYDIKAQHPDQFLINLLKLDCDIVCQAVRHHRTSLKHPAFTVGKYLNKLDQQSLKQSVLQLRQLTNLI